MPLRNSPLLAALIFSLTLPSLAQIPNSLPTTPPNSITSAWTFLKEGAAEGTIEPNAKHPNNASPNILRIAVTKYAAEPGTGRVGAKSTNTIPVKSGQVYDLTFNGISEGIGVGIVVSLESDDGKVLARTTLPEIGRGGRGGGGGNRGRRGGPPSTTPDAAATPTTAPAAPAAIVPITPTWRPYLVSLTVRTDSPTAHLTITPIEPVPILLDNLTLSQRIQP